MVGMVGVGRKREPGQSLLLAGPAMSKAQGPSLPNLVVMTEVNATSTEPS